MKKIDYSEIKKNIFNKDSSIFKCSSSVEITRNKLSSTDKMYIKNILSNMINIQSIVALNYLYKRELSFTDCVSHTFFLTEDIEEETKMFIAVFKNVFVRRKHDGTVVNIQVKGVRDLAYEVFDELLSENQIDECIKHLIIEKSFNQDSCETAFFQIEKHENISFIKNKYFDYLIKGASLPNIISIMVIDVSGFSIDEIENDEYIQQLATQVKHLYLSVCKSGIPGSNFYNKHLMFCVQKANTFKKQV